MVAKPWDELVMHAKISTTRYSPDVQQCPPVPDDEDCAGAIIHLRAIYPPQEEPQAASEQRQFLGTATNEHQ